MDQHIFRVGIIGAGQIFAAHVHAYPDNPYAVAVGFYDRIRTRAEAWKTQMARYMNSLKAAAQENVDPDDALHLERVRIFDTEARVYDNVQDLIQAVDVLDICAPNYVHAPYAVWALNYHKSVMTEKPPARCSLETKWLLEATEKSPAFYQLNENFYWQTVIREMKLQIDSGIIGDLKKITISLGHGVSAWGWQNHFLNPSLSGGGVLADMGSHALAYVFGLLGHNYSVQKIQSISMSTGTSPEKSIHDIDGQNEYYLHKFLVEDDAKIKIWLTSEHLPSPITVMLDTSWAKTSHSVSLEGTTGQCVLERDTKKQMVLGIYRDAAARTELAIPSQGRDSHQLEILDFFDHLVHKKQPLVDTWVAHQMQTIISGAYLSNLRAYESQQTKGKVITPVDLDQFYDEMMMSGCPKSVVLEEIIWKLMSPFANTYYSEKTPREMPPRSLFDEVS